MSSTFNHRRSRRITVAVLAAGTVLAASAGPAYAVPNAQARLASAAQSAPERKVVAIVQFQPGTAERSARALIRSHQGRVTGRLPVIHGLAVRLPAREARRLTRAEGVLGVTLNARVKPQGVSPNQLQTSYPRTVGASKVWPGVGGLTGKGVGVAVIDTGIAGGLADFKGADGRSRVVANVVTNPLAATGGDTYGHGTHVAGILAGNSFNRPAADPAYGAYVGIAPEADLVAVKVADEAGNATVLDVINGLQFVVDHKAEYNIRVVNLSLSSSTPSSYRTDPLNAAVEAAWLHGIVVVAAAGNRGNAADAVHYAPGNDPYAISVGGTEDAGTENVRDDRVAEWSSVGTTQDAVAKPDVLAPGTRMVSPLAPASAFQTLCPTCVLPGGYIRAGGTSMAAPVVAGAAALLIQAHPNWTPDQIKGTLMATDRPVAGADAGQINVDLAISSQPTTANRGLTPNDYIDAATGDIDTTRSSWSRSSWSAAGESLGAGWSRSSWSCSCANAAAAVDPTRSSWSRSSWSSRLEP